MPEPFHAPFPELLPATYLERPNRFILHCRLANGQQVRAFLPNPGRLQELLLPEVRVYLAPAAVRPSRKTGYTVVGVAGEEHPIFLHTHVNNAVARHLIESGQVPGLRRATIQRAEVPFGRSRFDFLLRHRGADVYLEVKSCTLFGNRVAMFPDAVTDRGRRHLEELAELARSGTKTAVLFIVHSNQVDWFMPDYHTDLAFSQTLVEVRDQVRIIPLAVAWREDFTLAPAPRALEIPWRYVAREARDRGNFLILCRTGTRAGQPAVAPGYYMYTGWCGERLGRFLARFKKGALPPPQFLGTPPGMEVVEAYPIVSSQDRQSAMDEQLQAHYAPSALPAQDFAETPPIAWTPNDPRQFRPFHHFLARFRMAHPEVP